VIDPVTCADIGKSPTGRTRTGTCQYQDSCYANNQTYSRTDYVCNVQAGVCDSDQDQTIVWAITSWETSPVCPGSTILTGDIRNGSNCVFIDTDDSCPPAQPNDNGDQYVCNTQSFSCAGDQDETIWWDQIEWSTSNTCPGGKEWNLSTRTGSDCRYQDSCDSARPNFVSSDYRCNSQSNQCDNGWDETVVWQNPTWESSLPCPGGKEWNLSQRDTETCTYRTTCNADETPQGTFRNRDCRWMSSCSAPRDYFTGDTRLVNCEALDDCGSKFDNGPTRVLSSGYFPSCPAGDYGPVRESANCWTAQTCSAPNYQGTTPIYTNKRFESTDLSSATVYCEKEPGDEFFTCWDIEYDCCAPEYQCWEDKRQCCDQESRCCIREEECCKTDTEYLCADKTYSCCKDQDLCCNDEYLCGIKRYDCCEDQTQCCNTEYACGTQSYQCCENQDYCCDVETECGNWKDQCCQSTGTCQRETRNCCEEWDHCCYNEDECCFDRYQCGIYADKCCEIVEDYSCTNGSSFTKDYPQAVNFGCPAVSNIGEGGYTNSSVPVPANTCLDSSDDTVYYCELESGMSGTCDEFTCEIIRSKFANYLDKKFIRNITDETDSSKQISLLSYGTVARLDHAMDYNTTSLISVVDTYLPIVGSKTCISCALRKAIDELVLSTNQFALRSIVLMTDGDTNTLLNGESGYDKQAEASLEAVNVACNQTDPNSAFSSNIVIYTVAFGSINDTETLINISNCTNGAFYQSNDTDELEQIYENIGQAIQESRPVPAIDVLNNQIIDFNISTQLAVNITWNDASCGSEANCRSLIKEMNIGLGSCNRNSSNSECDLLWNVSSFTPGNLTLKNLHLNTFFIYTGPVITNDGENDEDKEFTCDFDSENDPDCGDGVKQSGEQCDNGEHCSDGTPCSSNSDCSHLADSECIPRSGDGCSSSCTLESSECVWFDYEIYEDQYLYLDLNKKVDDFDENDLDLTWSWDQTADSNITISVDTYNVAHCIPVSDWNGWNLINFTVKDKKGQTAMMCINFTVIPVPDYGMSVPDESRLLISKGSMVSGYNEEITGEVMSWGPYIITIKVWEQDNR